MEGSFLPLGYVRERIDRESPGHTAALIRSRTHLVCGIHVSSRVEEFLRDLRGLCEVERRLEILCQGS